MFDGNLIFMSTPDGRHAPDVVLVPALDPPLGRGGTSRCSQLFAAAWNFELVSMFLGKIGPLPEKFGAGRLYPCCFTHATKLLIAVCEIRPRNAPPPPPPNPNFAPQALNAACIFGEMLRAPPPPKKKLRRGVVLVPVPVVPVPLPPPGGEPPGGRDGRVTPCAFRHDTSCARRALPEPPAAADPEDPEDEEAEAWAEVPLVVLLELLALPHAASAPPATRVTSATATRLDRTSNTFNTASFRK